MLAGKINKGLVPSRETKLFLLVEVPYAWLCFNSVIVIYGLFTETFTQSFKTGLSVASLVFGIAYLLLLMIASIAMAHR